MKPDLKVAENKGWRIRETINKDRRRKNATSKCEVFRMWWGATGG